MTLPDVRDREVLKAWLQERPRELSVTIAARSALRVLPLLAFRKRSPNDEIASGFANILIFLRAIAMPWVTAKYPPRNFFAYFDVSSAYEAEFDGSPEAAAKAAKAAVAAATQSAAALAAANAAAFTAEAFADDAFIDDASATTDDEDVFAAMAHDLELFSSNADVGAVLAMPLWPRGNLTGFNKALVAFSRRLEVLGEDWDVWIRWYEAILEGRPTPGGEELDIYRVKLGSGEDWEKGRQDPGYVNRLIKAKEAEIAGRLTARFSGEQQSRLGHHWRYTDVNFVITLSGQDSDTLAAATLAAQQLFDAVTRKSARLFQASRGVEENIGWVDEGFEDAVARFAGILPNSVADVPVVINALYDHVVELASFVDLDAALKGGGQGNKSPLPPTVHRALSDFIRSAALFIRLFPTALDLDESLGGFLGEARRYGVAKTILEAAANVPMITEADEQRLLELFKAAERAGFNADKAGARGIVSVRNLVFAAAMCAVLQNYAAKSTLINAAGDFLVAIETNILDLIADSAPDVRQAIADLIADIKSNRGNPPSGPSDSGVAIDPAARRRRGQE